MGRRREKSCEKKSRSCLCFIDWQRFIIVIDLDSFDILWFDDVFRSLNRIIEKSSTISLPSVKTASETQSAISALL